MRENKSVGPNLKTYFYYTNDMADVKKVKGTIVIATGIEGTGALYDEIGDYLDDKGYALYAIDEWGYGKTGKLVKSNYKNWKKKDFHFAAYNVHALSVLAKREHPDAPLYLIGNDFGAMLSLYLLKEFPEVVDKVVTIGWGTPTAKDYGVLFISWLRKVLFYDGGESEVGHFFEGKRFSLKQENKGEYYWLSSDANQVKKIRDAGYIHALGTVGHYYYYYRNKVNIPVHSNFKDVDHETPMLFMSGDKDLSTMKGKTTKALEKYFRKKKFNNVRSLIVSGQHELLFERNRFTNVDRILEWLEEDRLELSSTKEEYTRVNKDAEVEIVGQTILKSQSEEKHEEVKEEIKQDVVIEKEISSENEFNAFQEADDELFIKRTKEK